MVPDQTNLACLLAARVVIDDHCRLPGRFFGRYTQAIAAARLRRP